ncbi:MAG TPA: S8 family serine peptidase [Burkholderiaceae bacterium]|nr:S8 family serine peptidase [Burkholderiaceae bacterium]
MTRFLLALALWLAVALATHAADVAASEPVRPQQQILVLLKLPPEHYRPGSAYSGAYGDGLGRSARRRVAAELARRHGLTLASDWPVAVLGVDCYVMNVPAGQEPDLAALALARDERVAWAQAMNVYHALEYDDPLYGVQPVVTQWRLSQLHALATGRHVRVAVVDSGIESWHPDLSGQIELSENFVVARPYAAERHGTEVAGIIAARADNHVGIVGVAPASRLLALRACWQESAHATLCNSLSLALAIDFAISHDARVINLSLSGPPDKLLGQLLDAALARGIAVVAAVDRALPDGGFPASHPGTIAVVDERSELVPAAALLAPGRDVPTTVPPAQWDVVSGASFAAAHVSGLMALRAELVPLRAGQPPRSALVSLPGGAIDACATLANGHGSCDCQCAVQHVGAPGNPSQ